jgi:hypothetical protein
MFAERDVLHFLDLLRSGEPSPPQQLNAAEVKVVKKRAQWSRTEDKSKRVGTGRFKRRRMEVR